MKIFKKKIISFLSLLILTSFLLAPFTSLILSNSLREHAYREIMMHVIAQEETKGLKSGLEIAKRLFYYTAKNTLLNPGDLLPYNEKSLGYLINGLVYCDYAADILATLCAHKGIPARYAMLMDKDGVSPHTITEIFLDGKWRVFDPAEICYYTTKSGKLATLEDLSENSDLILENKRMQKIYPTGLPDVYKRMFPLPLPPQRSASKVKRITPFDKLGFFYYAVFGKRFLRPYQDLYLRIKTAKMQEEQKLYYLARNYQLVHRTDQAIEQYNDLLKAYPEGKHASRAALFLSFIYMDQKNNYLKAIEVLQSLIDRPENIYEKYALYYVGKCYQLSGDNFKAQQYFDLSGLFIKLDPSLAN